MPNIRIKDIPTTASATVNGDFFAVDSNASTRKLDAFNPTIGGILTVNGTGTSVFAGNANTALHVGAAAPYQRAAIGATRRLNYGDVLFSRNLQGQAGTDAYTTIGTDVGSGYAGFEAQYGGTARILVGTGSTTANAVVTPTVGLSVSTTAVATPLNTQIGGTPLIAPASIDRYLSVNVTALADNPALALSVSDGTKNARGSMYIDASTTQERMAWDFTYSSAQFPALEWRIAGNVHATLRNNGSLILSGTGTDSSNGRLQLASHTDSTGGIGMGTDWSFFRLNTSVLRFETASASPGLSLRHSSSGTELTLTASTATGNGIVNTASANNLVLGVNSGTALTLDVVQNATFAKDIFLGTSGPSVPSTLSGRAPRQGLVFNGTTGSTIAAPFTIGSGDFTVVAWITPTSLTGTQCILGGANNSFVLRMDSGTLGIGKQSIDGPIAISSTLTAGKAVLVAYTRSGNTGIGYVDGIAGTPISDSRDYSAANGLVGCSVDTGTAVWNGEISGPIVYNRALSAVEIKALYESGVAAAEDINSASNTGIANGTWTNVNYSTVTAATSSGFTATMASGIGYITSTLPFTPRRGTRLRLTGTLTLNAGTTPVPSAYVDGTGATLVPLTVGAFNVIVTVPANPTVAGVAMTTNGTANYTISGLVVTRLGAVMAPDAIQLGSGTRWWDTSGNNANLTLFPAIRWNAPFSGSLTLDGTNGLTFDTVGSASLRYNDSGIEKWWFYKLSGDANLYTRDMVNSRMHAVYSPGATDITASSNFYSNVVCNGTFYINNTLASIILGKTSATALNYDIRPMQAGGSIRIRQDASTADRYIALGRVDNLGAFTESMRVMSNVLIGTTTDSGALLQIGTNTTSSAGGMTFGTDVTLYRSAADTLRTDDAFQAERVSGDNSASAILGVLNTSGAGATNSFGIDARVIVNNSSGTTGSAIGLRALSRVSNASNVGAAIALVAQVDNPGAGTIATAYGLYVNPITVGANNYAIFTEGAAPSRFGGNVNLVGDLTVDKTEPTITFKRAANTNLNIINLWTGASADFGIGLRNTSDSDLHIYNYGTANDALKIAKATSAVTLSGNLTVLGTVVDPAITGTILEDIFTITDAAAFEVDPGNGSIQLITLGASRTPKATNFAAGESVTMMIDDGTAFTLTWTDATWGTGGVKWVGGSAPTLATTGYTVIQLWKVGTQVYGARVGDVV